MSQQLPPCPVCGAEPAVLRTKTTGGTPLTMVRCNSIRYAHTIETRGVGITPGRADATAKRRWRRLKLNLGGDGR